MNGNHYVDNKKLTKELGEWASRQRLLNESGQDREAVPDFIAKCILDICTNIVKKPNFANYTFREEMVGDAIENCIKYVSNFDRNKSKNAFAYVSQIAYSAIIRRIKKEKLTMTKHLRFIKSLVDVNELSNVVNSVSLEKDQEHYNNYLDNLKLLLDDLGEIEGEKVKPPPTQSKKKTVLQLQMEHGDIL